MDILSILFWLAFGIVFYAYLGYGIVLRVLLSLKHIFKPSSAPVDQGDFVPEVCFLVAAYNEADIIEAKIKNSLAQVYPAEKLTFLFITDGSDDQTPDIVRSYPQIRLMHRPERAGKIAATKRAMQTVTSPICIFSDANTMLNPEATARIVAKYRDPQVGAVAGEKRVMSKEKDSASAAGENLYWRYESLLKKWDGDFYSVVGAAGELFSIRTALMPDIEANAVIEDFVLTMRIAEKGYKIAYEPEAYAMESASLSVKEEQKRKVRISAGAFQAMIALKGLLNPFKHGWLSFQYLSHRVLRWSLAPLSLVILLSTNPILAHKYAGIYSALFLTQLSFYLLAFIGYIMESRSIRIKVLYVPYYFLMMNLCVFKGFFRFLKGQQTVLWEKAQRQAMT